MRIFGEVVTGQGKSQTAASGAGPLAAGSAFPFQILLLPKLMQDLGVFPDFPQRIL
jgi:hypothetical protein